MMRIALFLLTNLAVMVVFGLVLSLTGIQSSSVQGLMIDLQPRESKTLALTSREA